MPCAFWFLLSSTLSINVLRMSNRLAETPLHCYPLSTFSLPPFPFPSWYSHMSNGITTASGELVEGGEKRVGCLMLGDKWGRGRQRSRRRQWEIHLEEVEDTCRKWPDGLNFDIFTHIKHTYSNLLVVDDNFRFALIDSLDSGPLKETHCDLLFSSTRP